ncbi:hepatitis A virus cellular receptor 1 homolog [Callorhinchus milii]|uniref:hepatitis A virus cellular receptor 1 homolog n=1 Tax=Callorhinchus milii TaxID=7868 RepID=UPI001C3F7606|nr:hepatitis A virus cellular receptor 1 homolog [Callorhinchus milii]
MGTVGESVMLLCPLPSNGPKYKLVNVTWVRKEPYSHLVTFRQEGGSWNRTEGDERCELRGSAADGDITLTVSRLVTEDNGIYLCLVEAEKENKRLVIQREIRLQVQSSPGLAAIYILWLIPAVKCLFLLVMGIILVCNTRDRTRSQELQVKENI